MFTIELPDELKAEVEDGMARWGHASPREFIASLVYLDKARGEPEPISPELEALLLEGLNGEARILDDAEWEDFCRETDHRLDAAGRE